MFGDECQKSMQQVLMFSVPSSVFSELNIGVQYTIYAPTCAGQSCLWLHLLLVYQHSYQNFWSLIHVWILGKD